MAIKKELKHIADNGVCKRTALPQERLWYRLIECLSGSFMTEKARVVLKHVYCPTGSSKRKKLTICKHFLQLFHLKYFYFLSLSSCQKFETFIIRPSYRISEWEHRWKVLHELEQCCLQSEKEPVWVEAFSTTVLWKTKENAWKIFIQATCLMRMRVQDKMISPRSSFWFTLTTLRLRDPRKLYCNGLRTSWSPWQC